MVQLNFPPPDGFLEEETRCEHFVSKKMKEIWAVEIDLTLQILKVCEKYNLKIFADWGTALGAVRHKGFIPWDDDMDFCMLRDDYDKLLKVAKSEFEYPYYFDDAEGITMGGFPARLRNSQTTAIPPKDRKRNLKCNQGIFIDIFPLDNVPDNFLYFAIQKKIIRLLAVMACGFAYFSTNYYEPSNVLIRVPSKILHKVFRKPSEKLMRVSRTLLLKVATFFNKKQTARVTSLSNSYFQATMHNYYDNAFWMPFEYIHLPIIQAYDDLLKAEYGNYMVFKKYASEHEGMFCDPNRPYTDYVKGLK